MPISKVEAFDLGFMFANRIRGCGDSRDVGRILTCEEFPPEIRALVDVLNGFRSRDAGIFEAMNLIRTLLDTAEAEPEARLEET